MGCATESSRVEPRQYRDTSLGNAGEASERPDPIPTPMARPLNPPRLNPAIRFNPPQEIRQKRRSTQIDSQPECASDESSPLNPGNPGQPSAGNPPGSVGAPRSIPNPNVPAMNPARLNPGNPGQPPSERPLEASEHPDRFQQPLELPFATRGPIRRPKPTPPREKPAIPRGLPIRKNQVDFFGYPIFEPPKASVVGPAGLSL